MSIRIFLALAICFVFGNAHALTPGQAKAIAIGEGDARIEALRAAVAGADDKTVTFIQALSDDAVKVVAGNPVIVKDDKAVDPVSGTETALPDSAEDVMNNNRMRGELDTALASLKLLSTDPAVRLDAVKTLQGEVDESKLPLIDKAFAQETVPDIKDRLGLLRAAALLTSSDKTKRLEAAKLLAESSQAATKTLLIERLHDGGRRAGQSSTAIQPEPGGVPPGLGRPSGCHLQRHQSGLHPAAGGAGPGHHLRADGRHQHGPRRADDDWRVRHVRGSGSVSEICPGAFDWYLLASVPVAFLASALVGAALERSVIRFPCMAVRWKPCWPPGVSA
jgi:urea transport system permease protein